MTRAQAQRRELVDTLGGLSDEQWQAETLCAGWDAGDLVAHLVVRERDPLAAAGAVFGGPVERHHDRRMAERKQRGRDRLLAELADGPTWWMSVGPLDTVQAVEDWIHHEDVRRGGAGLPGRPTTADMAEPLWVAALRFARVTLARTRAPGVVRLTDGQRSESLRIGSTRSASRPDDAPDVTVTGSAGELALFATGRTAADVVIDGEAEIVAALSQNRRSV